MLYNYGMSLSMCCFASGSKGNCSYVTDGETNVLIDLGVSALKAEKCLEAVGADPDRVRILITHSHSDHVGGLKNFIKRHPRAAVHCQSESAAAVRSVTGVMPIVDGREYSMGSLRVNAVPVPHDVPCFGYVVRGGDKSVAVVTDIGTVKSDALNTLLGCDLVMLEANHDLTMLKNNYRYTAQLKARIASPHGHLSNSDCAAACAYLAENGVRNFILAHLSEENNDPALAVSEVKRAIESSGVTGARVIAASQNAMTGLFDIC